MFSVHHVGQCIIRKDSLINATHLSDSGTITACVHSSCRPAIIITIMGIGWQQIWKWWTLDWDLLRSRTIGNTQSSLVVHRLQIRGIRSSSSTTALRWNRRTQAIIVGCTFFCSELQNLEFRATKVPCNQKKKKKKVHTENTNIRGLEYITTPYSV